MRQPTWFAVRLSLKPDSQSARLKELVRALPPRGMEDMAKYVDITAYTDYVIVR